jgi:hypothetical protein
MAATAVRPIAIAEELDGKTVDSIEQVYRRTVRGGVSNG